MSQLPIKPIKRVVILWEHLTTYLYANLAAILKNPAVELLAVQRIAGENVQTPPLSHPRLKLIDLTVNEGVEAQLLPQLLDFQPDIALITGSSFPVYKQAAQHLSAQGCLVVWASDRIRRLPLKDSYQALQGRRGVWSHYHAAFVPGQAATAYAQFIGFPPQHIFTGLYSGNTSLFQPIGNTRHAQQEAWPRAFLFVGQLIKRKGVDTLLKAYGMYRKATIDPWDLFIGGAGPLASSLNELPGVQYVGYLSSEETAVLMSKAGCFILPSIWDHWGVVLHEAACAGLPILATHTCGAAADLVVEGKNGHLFPPDNPKVLAELMQRVTQNENGRSLGYHSSQLSRRFDPALFAQTLLETIPATVHHSQS